MPWQKYVKVDLIIIYITILCCKYDFFMHTGLMHTLLGHIVSHLALVQNLDSFQTIFIYFHWHQKYVIGGYRIHHVDRSYVLSNPPPFFF